MADPSRAELVSLLTRAHQSVVESERHWAAVIGLTGDRHFQRQQREAEALLLAMVKRVQRYKDDRGETPVSN